MSKKENETTNVASGEQLDLINVAPENTKEIVACAKRYKNAHTERIDALQKETDEKERLLNLIKQAHIQTLEGGKIRFRVDGYLITVTPRDELVQVKDDTKKRT